MSDNSLSRSRVGTRQNLTTEGLRDVDPHVWRLKWTGVPLRSAARRFESDVRRRAFALGGLQFLCGGECREQLRLAEHR